MSSAYTFELLNHVKVLGGISGGQETRVGFR